MASVFQRVAKFLSEIENTVIKSIYYRYPPKNSIPALVSLSHQMQNNYKEKSLSEILKEAVLWAVPKKRRSIEKRRCRRFGWPKYFYKMLLPKTNLLICTECGSYHEAGLLCSNCYSRVKEVTAEMQDAIEKHLGISPVENEVIVLYLNDEKQNPEFYKGKRIVEIRKEKPKLFCDNLLQKSTQAPATTQEVDTKKEIL